MKKKIAVVLGASLAVLLGCVVTLLACGDMASVRGRVTSSYTGEPISQYGASVSLMDEGGYSWYSSDNLSDEEIQNGQYSYSNVSPGSYTLDAWAYGYQSESRDITLSPGAAAVEDFALDPVPANVGIDVKELDLMSGSKTGDYRTVLVEATFQEICHYPERLVVWAYSADTGAVRIWDSADCGSFNLWDYLYHPDDTTANPVFSGYDCTMTLAFGWDTRALPNGDYTLKAALITSDMHGDGTDVDPDPVATHWVHQLGTPPASWGGADGTAGGDTLAVTVENVVITGYSASPGTIHYFKYDPAGSGTMAAPAITVTVANWRSEPMEIVVWMTPTAWGDTRPGYGDEAYMTLAISGPGTYTLTWDGANPNLGLGPGESEWGTYSYDIDVCKPTATCSMDWFQAKTYDGYSGQYDIYFGEHGISWELDDSSGDSSLVCWYKINANYPVPPSWVALTAIDPDLAEQATVSLTSAGDLSLGDRHPASPSPGKTVYTTTDYSKTGGCWRVVLTGWTNSGAELRRDRQDPPMLATNDPDELKHPHVVFSSTCPMSPLQLAEITVQLRLIAPDVSVDVTAAADETAHYVSFTDSSGLRYDNTNIREPTSAKLEQQARALGYNPAKTHFTAVNNDNDMEVSGTDADKIVGFQLERFATSVAPDRIVTRLTHAALSDNATYRPVVCDQDAAKLRALLHELGHSLGLGDEAHCTGALTCCKTNTTFTHSHVCVMVREPYAFFWYTDNLSTVCQFVPGIALAGGPTLKEHFLAHRRTIRCHLGI